jgi:ankyrin repeat protein
LWKGGLDAAKVLVEKGADIEAKDLRGQTPAFYAAASPNAVNAVAFLIEQGAEINLHDATGVTPLAVAVKYDRQTAIKILRAHGAVD